MKKNIIKLTLFMLILFMLLYFIIKFLWLEETALSLFYKEPNNSLDVIYIGSSNANYYFNNTLAYNLYGYTTGFLATDSQAFPYIKYCVKEAEKYQNPSLYIIDIAKVADELEFYDSLNTYAPEAIRRTADSLRFSKNRMDAISDVLNYATDIPKKDYFNYYFSFLAYHDRWKEIKSIIKSHISDKNKIYYKGYRFSELNTRTDPQDNYTWVDDSIELAEKNKKTLMDLLEYIKTNNLNVLFVVPIRIYKTEINEKINDAIKIIEDNNLEVINFNTLYDFKNQINFSEDLYNCHHLNVYGGTKYTLYFAKYIKEKYNLEDHRGDEKYISWENEYNSFKSKYKEITHDKFDDLLLEYNS